MSDIEVKLNWFERHLNWTYGIVSAIAVIVLPAITILAVVMKVPLILEQISLLAQVLVILQILVIISFGILVIILKGRSLWLTAAALWPFIPALIALNQERSSIWLDTLTYFLNFSMTLYVGMIINMIILLCLSNKKYWQISTYENSKLVKRWYKIEKSD